MLICENVEVLILINIFNQLVYSQSKILKWNLEVEVENTKMVQCELLLTVSNSSL